MQFGSCCCRANTSCEAKQIPNDFQKHHSHIQRPKTHSPKRLFSTKTFSTVNETCPDMMASCSFPENTKNNDLYLVRRRDLVKTNLNTSASYLLVNSRAKCNTHSIPNAKTQTDLITTTSRKRTQWGRPPPRRVFNQNTKPNNGSHCTSRSTLFHTGNDESKVSLLFMQHALCYVGLLALVPS